MPVLLITHFPVCILCEGAGTRFLIRAYLLSTHPVLVEVEHAEYVVVLHDSAIEVYIPVLLIVYSILCILREGAGASLSTRACFSLYTSRISRSQER
jgi:hypothetical protein